MAILLWLRFWFMYKAVLSNVLVVESVVLLSHIDIHLSPALAGKLNSSDNYVNPFCWTIADSAGRAAARF